MQLICTVAAAAAESLDEGLRRQDEGGNRKPCLHAILSDGVHVLQLNIELA